MVLLFVFSLIGVLLLLPLHFLSVEHTKLDARYGKDKGKRVGSVLGIISGWGYFIFLFGIWLAPQEKFNLPVFDQEILLIGDWFSISGIDLLLGMLFILPGMWFGIKGVTDLGLEVSETHRAEKVIKSGVYSRVRHPQYLGAMLAHIGITMLLSQLFALIVTPIIMLRDFVACRKEERELVREFGTEYEEYRKQVPMLLPRLREKGSEMEAIQ
ncbi:MAG: methyltransferase family protein [Candidatus Thorarchaeota archaeon]